MKVIIAGSASLQNEIQKWVEYWNEQKDCLVFNYPQTVPLNNFDELYPDVHKKFFTDILEADIFFVANEDKKGVAGYIGYEAFAELGFAVAQKLISGQKIKIILAKMPSLELSCHEEIVLWKRLGWIDEIINK